MTEAIIGIAPRGDGVGDRGGFFPGTAPGDVVGSDGRISAGPHHQSPPCRHFPECGGCQLQHVDDSAYRQFLVDRVTSALAGQSLTADVRAPYLSPPKSRRRANLKAERQGSRALIGFNAEGSHRIIDMRECHVLRRELFQLIDPIRQLLAARLPPRRRVDVGMTVVDQGVDLAIGGLNAQGLEAAEQLSDFARNQRLARLTIEEAGDRGYAQTVWEPDPVTVNFRGARVGFPSGAFLQATVDGEQSLVDAVTVALAGCETVADLFSGLGTFALTCASCGYAAEGSRDLVTALASAVRQGMRKIGTAHRDLYRNPLSPAELDRFDGVVLDPPRAGAREQVLALAQSRVCRIAYVSCNPVTFARDAALLASKGYRVDWVQPVGQFRWSTHVELVGALSRAQA